MHSKARIQEPEQLRSALSLESAAVSGGYPPPSQRCQRHRGELRHLFSRLLGPTGSSRPRFIFQPCRRPASRAVPQQLKIAVGTGLWCCIGGKSDGKIARGTSRE